MLLGAQKDLGCGRMIRLLHEHAQDLLTLPGEPDPAGRQSLGYLPGKLHLNSIARAENDIKNYSQ
jgi:hypothetical protein